MKKYQSGFTLIEIAIVLLIIGLLLGGVMKGQALINSARVRAIANDLSGIEAAWVSFRDRYRALPGDFPRASTHIVAGAVDGNANAIVDSAAEAGAVWQHLASAGFISGNFDGSAVASLNTTACVEQTCPLNPFNGFYKISNTQNGLGSSTLSHELATGGNIPVAVMYELDLKIDDGKPDSGRFRAYDQSPHNACVAGTEWDVVTGHADCAGVLQLPL
jgi:prepilin-type N-terminal cleavage/methylation domain-containing protein